MSAHLRRFSSRVGLLAALLALGVPGAHAASSIDFHAATTADWGIRATTVPCVDEPSGFVCYARGAVAGYGFVEEAQYVRLDDGGYASVTHVFTLGDGSTLTTSDDLGTLDFMPIGRSADAADGSHGRGNPSVLRWRWTVVEGTGVFAGATGGGTGLVTSAGDTLTYQFRGTLELP